MIFEERISDHRNVHYGVITRDVPNTSKEATGMF